MKKIMLIVVLIAAFAAGIFGYRTMSKDKQYNSDIRNAHAALNQQDWASARQYYKASQKEKVSVEARTALEQLDYAVSAAKKADKRDWQEALSMYKSAMGVDGAIDIVNKNVKIAVKDLKAKRVSIKNATSTSKARAASKAAEAAASSAAASSAKAAYSSSVAANYSSSSATSGSQSSSVAASSSSERQMDSTDIATARKQWSDLGYNVANLSPADIQVAMNKVIDSHGGLTMDEVAQQMGWTKQ